MMSKNFLLNTEQKRKLNKNDIFLPRHGRRRTFTSKSLHQNHFWKVKYKTRGQWLSSLISIILLFCYFSDVLAYVGPAASIEEEIKVLSVEGVAGESSSLPCPLSPRSPGDSPKLVLWYISGDKSPIYSHDGRSDSLPVGLPIQVSRKFHSQHPDKKVSRKGHRKSYRKGLQLDINPVSATLKIKHTDATSSEGVYECRVDYYHSPSQTIFVNLTVIEPPALLEIEDTDGKKLAGSTSLGPYNEGSTVTLKCTAKYGNPPPSVSWILNGEQTLDDSAEISDDSAVTNEMEISKVSRSWSNASLTCLAVNSDLVEPLTKTFNLRLNLLPLSVQISGPRTANASSDVIFRCISEGSDPPAVNVWRINGDIVEGKTISKTGSTTTSELRFKVTKDYDRVEIRCESYNKLLPNNILYNTTFLEVHYAPVVVASLGRALTMSAIREDDDVYFSCSVRANPPASDIIWYHNDKRQVHNVSEGLILTVSDLAMQRVNKSKSGRYHCVAVNAMGVSQSEPVYLQIKYHPECVTKVVTYFIYNDPINVTCSFASYPSLSKITWHWNSTNGNDVNSSKPIARPKQIPSNPRKEEGDISSAYFPVYPSMISEDRELTCRGYNELGNQTKPCQFFIKRGKMPPPLSSCRLANITASSLSLTCETPDTPAGGATAYRAQVLLENGTLFANLTSPLPSFNVSHLDQGTNYQIKVYVSQGPITSQPVLMSASTSRDGIREKITTQISSPQRTIPLVAIFIGVLIPLVLIITMLILRRKFCSTVTSSGSNPEGYDNKLRQASTSRSCDFERENVSNYTKSIDENSAGNTSMDEINPDVVPYRDENVDLLPQRSPELQSYFVRDPDSEDTVVNEPRMDFDTEEFYPMLKERGDSPSGVPDIPSLSNYEPESNSGIRYNVGVTIGGMGQTVTGIFRSRSRGQNLSSLFGRGGVGADHETIV